MTVDDRQQSRRFLIATGFAFFVVFVTRALAFPHSWWLSVEPLLGMAIDHPNPTAGITPSPGFPLYLALARSLMFKAETPFVALVAASFVASVGATLLLAAALYRLNRDAVGGALASLILFMTPAMLVFSSTPAPEASAVMFLAIAILGAARLIDRESRSWRDAALLGAAAGCTTGCQPEWVVCAAALIMAPLVRREAARFVPVALIVFGGTLSLVFASFVQALGGGSELVRWLMGAVGNPGSKGALGMAALFDAFGPPWLSIPIALLAIAGAIAAVRARERLVLLVVAPALANLALVALRGSAREPVLAILPACIAVSALCGRGLGELSRRAGQPLIRIGIVALFCLASWMWTAPLLRARLNEAPPSSKAAIWIDDHVESGAVVLVARDLAPHAAALITNGRVVGLEAAAAPERALAQYALVPGESTQAGAVIFSWPDSAPLRRLAGSRLRVVSVVPLRPSTRSQ